MSEIKEDENNGLLDEVQPETLDPDLFEEELNKKIENYFTSNNNELLSFEQLDDFLKAIDLYEIWNSEDEKDTLWASLQKYNINNKVDKNGAIKGMHDLLNNQDDDSQKDGKDDNILTRDSRVSIKNELLSRISRVSIRNDGTGTVNKLVLSKHKQKAIDEYDNLDNPSLIQLKKIFLLLNINEDNKKNIISVEKIDEIVKKHKFIKIERNDIIKYISYLTCEDKPLDQIKTLNINMDIFYEIDLLLQEKLVDEDLENYEEYEEDENGEKLRDPLEIIEELLKKIEETQDNIVVLRDMKNNLVSLNENMSETISKAIEDDEKENQHENISNIESLQSIINEKIEKFDEYFQNLNRDQKLNVKKIQSLKKSILAANKSIDTLKEDYRVLYEKYNNNQEVEVDEETERLLEENVALNQEVNSNKEQIENLIAQRKERDIQINELYEKIDEDKNTEEKLRKQIAELKISNTKYKEDYEKLMDTVVNKIQKRENEEKRERDRINKLIKEEVEKKNDKSNEKDGGVNEINIKELENIDKMTIPISEKLLKKKKILGQLTNEKLLEYVLKCERLNINLKSDKTKKEKTIEELDETITQLNKTINKNRKEIANYKIDFNIQKDKIERLQKEVKQSQIYRPSIAMTSNTRISRLSKLVNPGLNAQKFSNLKKKMNSSDYFMNKNMAFGVTANLKNKNINERIGKQKTNLAQQSIMNSIYGNVEENKIEEEQNEEDKDEVSAKKEKENNKESKDEDKKEIKNNLIFEKSNNIETSIEGHKMPFTNLQKDGIEIDIKKNELNIGGEEEIIMVDNINDINLGGSNKELIEIKNNGINSESTKKDEQSSQHQVTESFFESKPVVKNDEITKNKTDLDMIAKRGNNLYNESKNKIQGDFYSTNFANTDMYTKDNDVLDEFQRDTIEINQNPNLSGQLEDFMFGSVEMNTGRESENNPELKNKLEISKYGMNISDKKNNTNHNDKFKSSENLIINSKDKLNQIEIGKENDINLEGNKETKNESNNNKINENKLEINNNSINIESKNNKVNENKLEISNNTINIDKNDNNNKINENKLEISNNNINIDKSDNNNKINNNNKIIEINKNDAFNVQGNNKNNKKLEMFKVNKNSINIEGEEGQINRKRTVIDTVDSKVSASNILGLSESNIEIKGRKRNNSLKTENNSNIIKKDIEEIENNNYDYCSLFHEDYVISKLHEKHDNANEKNIYSDQIFLFSKDKKKLEKKLILLTPSNIYIFEERNGQFNNSISKDEISKFAISNKNLNILTIVKGTENIIILTLRRMDLLFYLREYYRKSQRTIGISYIDKFKMNIKGKETELFVTDKIFRTFSNFDGAIKIGYLLKLSHFLKIFQQRLVALTSIGLIVFDDPNSPPERLYPIIGSKIEKVLGNKYKRSNCFEITTLAGEVKVFSAYKERELKSWLEEFKKIQKDFENKMKKLDTIQKHAFIENSTLNNVKEVENDDELIPNSEE